MVTGDMDRAGVRERNTSIVACCAVDHNTFVASSYEVPLSRMSATRLGDDDCGITATLLCT